MNSADDSIPRPNRQVEFRTANGLINTHRLQRKEAVRPAEESLYANIESLQMGGVVTLKKQLERIATAADPALFRIAGSSHIFRDSHEFPIDNVMPEVARIDAGYER